MRKAEEAINTCYERVEALERQLRNSNQSDEKQEVTSLELAEVKKLLETNQRQLSTLHKQNRKSFVFGAALVLVFFTIYMLYVLVMGPDF